MKTNQIREKFVSLRATEDEISSWDQAKRAQGFRSRSQFMRQSINAAANPKTETVWSTEQSFQLKRVESDLTDIQAKLAANDNDQMDPYLEERLHEALNHVLSISKNRK